MTKIPSVEERVEEFSKDFTCINNHCDQSGCIPHQTEEGWEPQQCEYCYVVRFPLIEKYTQALTEQRTALLTELRDSGLLEEKDTSAFENDPLHPVKTNYIGHNDLARAIKAHINNLINPTSV